MSSLVPQSQGRSPLIPVSAGIPRAPEPLRVDTSPWRTGFAIGAGALLTLTGLALLVLPGPGTPLLIAGLALLAPHWPWAQRVLNRLRAGVEAARSRLRNVR